MELLDEINSGSEKNELKCFIKQQFQQHEKI